MSLSIYNGYSIPKKTIEALLTWVQEIRLDLEEAKLKQMAKIIKDYKSSMPNKSNMEIALEIQNKVWSNTSPQTRGMYDYFSLGLDVIFIPMNDKTLCLTYSNNKEIEQAWQNLSEVKSYWYSNRSDSDSTCSSQEWTQRAIDWEKALGDEAIPTKAGFSITVLSSDFSIIFERNRKKIEVLMSQLP